MDAPQDTPLTIVRFDDFWDSKKTNPFRFLSNFYVMTKPVTIDLPWTGPMSAVTTEHLFAAAKADNAKEQKKILDAPTPGRAKLYGRMCQLIPEWDLVCMAVMRCCIEAKFKDGSHLAKKLVGTYPFHLREGTTWDDRRWGVDVTDDAQPGQNMLGMLLMDHRARLMDGLPPMGFLDERTPRD